MDSDSDLYEKRDNTPLWIKPEPYIDNSSKYRITYLKSPTSPRKVPPSDEFCLSCSSHLNFSSAMRRKLSSKRKSDFESICEGGYNMFQGDRDYIGFATLPEQVHRKSVKRGFHFTLMVVGESGLGKSTLINSLFLSDLYKDRKIPEAYERVTKTTQIERKTMDVEERGVKLRLTVVDTPGFGDSLNCEDSWRACCNYIDEQFHQYFTDESGLNRKNIIDNRVHCCLYFIPPYGHGLRQLDIELMKQIQHKVNIVPIIGKADTLTEPEMKRLKKRILNDIQENNIQIYQFPECDSDEDEDFKQQDKELKECVPFAVIGSHNIIEVGGKKVRGRQYPWGIVEVENSKHSDFSKLRNMLITTHMQDLKDVTEDVYYENFRVHCISQISQHAIKERGDKNKINTVRKLELYLSAIEKQEIRLFRLKNRENKTWAKIRKLKRESTTPMVGTITETDKLLLQKDEEIRQMQDMLSQMQEKLKATSRSSNSIYSDSQTPTEIDYKRKDSMINV